MDPIYMTDMHLLDKTTTEVFVEFMKGNFVVKRTNHRFKQVSADQATEWINNYQAKIWLHEDQEDFVDAFSVDTAA